MPCALLDCGRAIAYGAAISTLVMAGLVPAIHVFLRKEMETWMPGTSPGMTEFVGSRAHMR
ncbi:hypothetical protein QU42_15195 [Bradyrhizobium sp. UASWS1016]|nr:hypothetical protein QU41_04995 [Bradyrhizobium elkanii]OCX30358.1 hypothetical protein QU42_15195 [Bradyrhizobium sp. UASWS1016]